MCVPRASIASGACTRATVRLHSGFCIKRLIIGGVNQLSLRVHLALAPAVLLAVIAALLAFLLVQAHALQRQNEVIREWTRTIEHVEGALAAARHLQTLAAAKVADTDARSRAELEFSYLEQSALFGDHALAPALRARLRAEERAELESAAAALHYRDDRIPAQAATTLAAIVPALETWQRRFWLEKRGAYERYYEDMRNLGNRMLTVSLVTLALGFLVGGGLVWWSARRLRQRLGAIAAAARIPATAPGGGDEIDALAHALHARAQQLVQSASAERLLTGAEDERRRIAMDLHDQVLSDLSANLRALDTALARADGALRTELTAVKKNLQASIDGIRAIMDDLHPQTLDLLGLEAALRSHMQRHLAQAGMPALALAVAPAVESALAASERLALYRIVLEAIYNVVRHAHATRCEIDARVEDDAIVLTVEDNGCGFVPAKVVRGRGLDNIERRARSIGATVVWTRARFSTGARMELRLPRALVSASAKGTVTHGG